MKNCFVLVLLLSLLIPSAGESYAGELFKKKKKKETTEAVKQPVVKKKNKYQTLMKSPGIVTAKGDFLTIHKVGQKIYLEYPLKYVGREILVGGTVSATSEPMLLNVGYKYNDPILYRVVKKDSAIVFNKPNLAATAGEDKPWVKKAMEKNYIDMQSNTFSIHSYNADSSAVVIDVTSFLKDNKGLAPKISAGPISSSPVASKFSFEGVKAFEDNASVQVSQPVEASIQTFFSKINLGQVSSHSVITFLLLPEAKMRPRVQDSRVGVFFTVNTASDRMQLPIRKISQEKDGFDTYILANRWRLEPKDVEAWKRGELVEPVKPIVWYVDDAFPDEWRGPIKEGILIWNKAFEKIGFKNVMVAKDFPKDDPNFDPDNLKYTCIRYSPNAEANAMGPSWVDPTTGEIINASVIVYNNIVELINNWRFVQTAQLDPRVRASKMPKDVLDESIVYVISHEIGHTLGLLHNMAASASIPVDSLRSASFTQKYGTTPSIMDYARFNYVAQPGDKGVKLTPPDLGVYDEYVIKWLYTPLPGLSPKEEVAVLESWIDEKAGDPLYRYGKQQVIERYDPSAIEEDLGNDPIKAGEYGIKNLQYILSHLNEWIKDDVDGAYKEQMYNELGNQYYRYLRNVMYNVGGIYLSEVKAGTPGKTFQSVPKDIQRKSFLWVLKQLKNSDWLHNESLVDQFGLRVALPPIVRYYTGTELLGCYTKVMLSAHVSKDPYTMKDYFDDMYAQIWESAIKNRKPTEGEKVLQRLSIDQSADMITKKSKLVKVLTDEDVPSVGNEAYLPSVDEIVTYGLDELGLVSAFRDELREIERAKGHGYVAKHMALTSFKYGYGWQYRVNTRTIDDSKTRFHAYAIRVKNLLNSKLSSSDAETRAHYQAMLYTLDEALKALNDK